MSASRRKSLNNLTHFAEAEDKPSPALFNLRDLLLTSLRSESQQTIAATLRLVCVMIQKHHHHTLSVLMRISPETQASTQRTIGTHKKEMEIFISLAEDLGEDDHVDQSYGNYLKDSLDLLECHPCSAPLLANGDRYDPTSTQSATAGSRTSSMSLSRHRIQLDDSLLEAILALLGTFMTNSAETNLNLSETVVELASCGALMLEGWLVVDPSNYLYDEEISDSDIEEDLVSDPGLPSCEGGNKTENNERNQMRGLQMAYRKPSWTAEDTPPILAILQSLVDQVHLYRQEIPNFDTHVSERREAFQVDEKLSEVLASIPLPNQGSEDSSRLSASSPLSPDVGHLGSISQRIFPENASMSVSRSSSPRGRQQTTPGTPVPVSRLRELSMKGSTIPAQASRRAFSPSPLRKDALSSSPLQLSKPQSADADADVLKRKIGPISKGPVAKILAKDQESSETSSLFSESTTPNEERLVAPAEVSISHLLTNVVLLQEFILELAAIIQVRASLFGEVKFT